MAKKKSIPQKHPQPVPPTAEELVYERQGQAFTNTEVIARYFERQPKRILAEADKLKVEIESGGRQRWPRKLRFPPVFVESTYKKRGKNERMLLLNKAAWMRLSMRLRGPKAEELREIITELFLCMEEALADRRAMHQDQTWIDLREGGKIPRRKMTDAIQVLVDYAEARGSENAQWFYHNYTAIINKLLFDEYHSLPSMDAIRDRCNKQQLHVLATTEGRVAQLIHAEVEKKTDYHDIYAIVKEAVTAIAEALGGPTGIGPLDHTRGQLALAL